MLRAGLEDEFYRVMGVESIQHPSHGGSGGEYDILRSTPSKDKRILIGAKLLTPNGLHPDVAATHVIGPQTGYYDTCDAMEWFIKTALLMIKEKRQRKHYDRHLRLAKKHGYKTYYAYRTFEAIKMGYDSIYDMRKKRWDT